MLRGLVLANCCIFILKVWARIAVLWNSFLFVFFFKYNSFKWEHILLKWFDCQVTFMSAQRSKVLLRAATRKGTFEQIKTISVMNSYNNKLQWLENDYLRKVRRWPACVMATSVLVTEVPMLVPMMMGTASWTVSTARIKFHSLSPLPHNSKIISVWAVQRLRLTSRGDHADNNRGGGGWALDQQRD